MESFLELLSNKFHEIMKEKQVIEDKELENEIAKCFPEYTIVCSLFYFRMQSTEKYVKL